MPLFGGLDTIKDAAATLADAERLGADLWGADWCRYSTGGSTHVNQAAALAVGRPGTDGAGQPNGAPQHAVRADPGRARSRCGCPATSTPRFGLPTGLSLPALEAALAEHPDAAAVFCVEPSYVGTLSDLPAVVALAHAHGVAVVVDQAWGGHFGFHPAYPAHALQAGADALITSAHKALPAYSQAALLLARTERLDAARLDRAFDASATTSPSGTILASIDASRALLADPLGRDLLDRLVAHRRRGASAAARRTGTPCPGPEDFAPGRFDPAKLVVLLDRVDGNAIERGPDRRGRAGRAGRPRHARADRDDARRRRDRRAAVQRDRSPPNWAMPRPRAAASVWTAQHSAVGDVPARRVLRRARVRPRVGCRRAGERRTDRARIRPESRCSLPER